MTDPLTAEPDLHPDATFRNWMRLNLGRAATEFGLTVTGPPIFGWRLRSIGATARDPGGEYWLRVVSEEQQWTHLDFWTGNHDANVITGIPRPRVVRTTEWDEGTWRRQRAEQLTLLPGEVCSPTDVIRDDIDLTPSWWADLNHSLATLADVPTMRRNADQDRVTRRIHAAFGGDVELRVQHWQTVHGDLHWANLLQPRLGIVDWELWGRGPVGTDAATLYCYSLLTPRLADRVREVFSTVLDSPAGRIAQLYSAARLLQRVEQGDHPDLAEPLRHHADSLL